MTKINFIVNDLLSKYEGGEIYFDKLDEELRKPCNLDIIFELFQLIADSNVIVSGKFGLYILELFDKKIIECKSLIVVSGGLRQGEITEFLTREFKPNSNFVFVDDSYYLGRTRDKISQFLLKNKCLLEKTMVVYDGSLTKNDNVFSLYRYHL